MVASILLAVPLVMAQQEDSFGALPEANQAADKAQPGSAPQLGHPLDPAAVDVLTGKDKARSASSYGQYAYPAMLDYGYGYGSRSGSPSVSRAGTRKRGV